MAEQTKQARQTHESETEPNNQRKEMLQRIGMIALTGFLSGLAMAAGTHAYQSAASRFVGRSYKGSVHSIRSVS